MKLFQTFEFITAFIFVIHSIAKIMDHLDENSLNKPVLDIVKEFKANGNFDQFRKDCFSEITSQPSFHTLSKNVEDLVQKFLREQSHSLRKNDMRDLLRRKLNE